VLSLYDLKWVRKCWSARGMIRHASAGPLNAYMQVADSCDPSSAGTLTHAKSLVACVESVFATVPEQFAIADCFLSFW
jgi:hypothetical protein